MTHRTVICALLVGVVGVALACGQVTQRSDLAADSTPVSPPAPIVVPSPSPTAPAVQTVEDAEESSAAIVASIDKETVPTQDVALPADKPAPRNETPVETEPKVSTGPPEALLTRRYVRGPTTLDERIFKADAIALVELEQATPTSRSFTDQSFAGTRYIPFLDVVFRVEETLEGSALPSRISVEIKVLPEYDREAGGTFHFATASEAEQSARAWTLANPETFSGDSAVFLKTLANSDPVWDITRPASEYTRYVFVGESSADGFIASFKDSVTLNGDNKVALPLTGAGSGEARTLYLDNPSDESEASTMKLSDLKTRIVTVGNMLDDSIEGHKECLLWKFVEERSSRPRLPEFIQVSTMEVDSGQPSGSRLYTFSGQNVGGYSRHFAEGPDGDLFTIPNSDDDTDPANGYSANLRNTRPLPAGQYVIHTGRQFGIAQPCNHVSQVRRKLTVNAVSPEGTLHELFFDPVAVGSGVAADATNGVLKPSSFTGANGASASIEGISYESSTVRVEVTPDDALDGHIVDIIELDGTVSLSLDAFDATVDAANGTLSWSVSSQPWDDGDTLMVRIREASP